MSTSPRMKRAVTEELIEVSQKLESVATATSQDQAGQAKPLRPQTSSAALLDSGIGTENPSRKTSALCPENPLHQSSSSSDPPMEAVREVVQSKCPVKITVQEDGTLPKEISITSTPKTDRSDMNFLMPRKISTSSIISSTSEGFVTAPSSPDQTMSPSIPMKPLLNSTATRSEINIGLTIDSASDWNRDINLQVQAEHFRLNLSIKPNTDATRRRRRSFSSSCSSSSSSPHSPNKHSQSFDDPSPTSPTDSNEIIKRLLHDNLDDFVKSTNMEALSTHLVSANLLSRDDLEEVEAKNKTSHARNLHFYVFTLHSKGSDAYRRMYDCLKKEQEHLGHKDLVRIIEEGLGL